MDLTEEQVSALRGWIDAGATLGEVQGRLKEEFELSITYLDTRFLLADLGIELAEDEDEGSPEPASADGSTPPQEVGSEGGGQDQAGDLPHPDEPSPDDPLPGGGGVSVSVDTIAQPHAIVSGRVTFSDGESAAWYLDQMGRLGLDPATEQYQPSQEDVAAFQVELQRVLREKGV